MCVIDLIDSCQQNLEGPARQPVDFGRRFEVSISCCFVEDGRLVDRAKNMNFTHKNVVA